MQRFRRETMKESCKHTFIGKAAGVHCTKCGVSMTTEAYRAYLAPRQTPKKKAVPRKKKTEKEEANGD